MTKAEIKKELKALADMKYKEFHSALLPGTDNVLGVRIPQLRTMAKLLAKQNDWHSFVEDSQTEYYEETMLQGMIIGLAKIDLKEQLKYINLFIPRINNWAVCDIFCGELKTAVRKGKESTWEFILPYLQSEEEFKIRFGVVMLFHFIDDNHIDYILHYADTFHHEGYYARMGVAWLISICFIKFPDKTMEYLKYSQLDNWTYNKSLQKITESLRVEKDTKKIIRSMKRQ